ncbi:MAG: DUF2911 domain-containing protein [Flavobacteriaceae bacterium]|nr:DUF2911 domain-containing protein [Flavobacteriaceae bacterium]
MKKYLIIFTLLAFSYSFSQIKTPQPSPATSMNQMVGLTEIEVEYSRPSMRGREIFGNLVPYGKIWRTGANASTKISFSDDVVINDNKVKAGKYSVFTIPNESEWEFILYNDTSVRGVPGDWDDKNVVLSTMVEMKKLPEPISIETFTIFFDALNNNYAVMLMMWDDVYVPVTINVPTRDIVKKNIQEVMSKSPKASDYYAAAVYYMQENADLNMALEWMDKAIEMSEKPQFWQLRQQSLIYAANGDLKGAIRIAKNSLEAAKIAGNQDYVKMNKDSIEEWSN